MVIVDQTPKGRWIILLRNPGTTRYTGAKPNVLGHHALPSFVIQSSSFLRASSFNIALRHF
jgi:hypothetical protein